MLLSSMQMTSNWQGRLLDDIEGKTAIDSLED